MRDIAINSKGDEVKNTNKTNKILLNTKLAVGIAAAMVGGYAGRVQAAPSHSNCAGAAGTYTCSGATTDTQSFDSNGGLTITTAASFSVNTTASNGLSINSHNGPIVFDDGGSANAITAKGSAIGTTNTSGVTSITTSGHLLAESAGINAYSEYAGISIETSGNVEASKGSGIIARTNGSPEQLSINITTNGTVSGKQRGIYASVANNNASSNIQITTNGAINSDNTGIYAYNSGNQDTSNIQITTNNTITVGNHGTGVYAYSDNDASSDIQITTNGSIIAGRGITASIQSDKYGDITINSNNTISASDYQGIYAFTESGSVSVTTTDSITSKDTGVSLMSYEEGPISVTVGGDITSVDSDGIRLDSPSSAIVTGSGNITSGSGHNQDGIDVRAKDDVTIDVNGTISGDPGITVTSDAGPISITGTGDVNANPNDGIHAVINAKGTNEAITIARDGVITATGGGDGIFAVNHNPNGNINITVNHAINTNAAGVGINTATDAGVSLITLNSGAVVGGAGKAIVNDNAASLVKVNTGASVANSIELGDGNDTLEFLGGSFAPDIVLDGGAGTDSLLFDNGTHGTLLGANVINWGSLEILNAQINITGNLSVGTFANEGLLSSQNGITGETLSVANNYSTGGSDEGVIALDVQLDSGAPTVADKFVVEGNTSERTILRINNAGGAGEPTAGNGILVVQVNGNSNGTFELAAPVRAGDYLYNLVKVGKNWYLQSEFSLAPASPIPTLSQWGQIILISMLGLFGMFGFRRRH